MWTKFGTWQPIHIYLLSFSTVLTALHSPPVPLLPSLRLQLTLVCLLLLLGWDPYTRDKGTVHSKRSGNSFAEGSCKANSERRQRDGPAEQAWQRCRWAAPWAKVAAVDIVQVLAKPCHLVWQSPLHSGSCPLTSSASLAQGALFGRQIPATLPRSPYVSWDHPHVWHLDHRPATRGQWMSTEGGREGGSSRVQAVERTEIDRGERQMGKLKQRWGQWTSSAEGSISGLPGEDAAGWQEKREVLT